MTKNRIRELLLDEIECGGEGNAAPLRVACAIGCKGCPWLVIEDTGVNCIALDEPEERDIYIAMMAAILEIDL